MTRIVLDLDVAEAVVVYGVLEGRAAEGFRAWRFLAETHAPADEQEAAKLMADIVNRAAVRLANALWPRCDWLEECDMTVPTGERYCRFHAAKIAETRAAVPA